MKSGQDLWLPHVKIVVAVATSIPELLQKLFLQCLQKGTRLVSLHVCWDHVL